MTRRARPYLEQKPRTGARIAGIVMTALVAAALTGCRKAPPETPTPEPSAPPAPTASVATATVTAQSESEPAPELQSAMRSLAAAMRGEDVDAIAKAFSQSKPWNALNTSVDGQPVIPLSYERLDHALRETGEAHDSLLGTATKSLRTYFSGEHAASWQALNQVQFAPHSVPRGKVWIAWRQEDYRWVVDTIAWPLQAQ